MVVLLNLITFCAVQNRAKVRGVKKVKSTFLDVFGLQKRTFNFLTAKMHSSLSFKDYYTRQIKERISPK